MQRAIARDNMSPEERAKDHAIRAEMASYPRRTFKHGPNGGWVWADTDEPFVPGAPPKPYNQEDYPLGKPNRGLVPHSFDELLTVKNYGIQGMRDNRTWNAGMDVARERIAAKKRVENWRAEQQS